MEVKRSDIPMLPFDAIGEEFDNLLEATVNKLKREWPSKWREYPGAKIIFESFIRVVRNTYQSIRFLAAEKPPNSARKIEYSLSGFPLARVILDSLFTIVFLFDDLSSHTEWYYKSGWREIVEDYQRYLNNYLFHHQVQSLIPLDTLCLSYRIPL